MDCTMMIKTIVCFVIHEQTHVFLQQLQQNASPRLLCKMEFATAQLHSFRVDFNASILLSVEQGSTIEETTYV
jgi:hypothetical protein